MKKILIVGYTDNMGGLESFLLNYYGSIDKKEVQFEFIVHYKKIPKEEEIKKSGGKIWYIPRKSNNLIAYRREMKRFFKDNATRYSAIWVNICSLSNNDHIRYAKKYKIPKRIIHSHNTNETRGVIRKMLHYINRVFLPLYATDYWACSNVAGKWFYSKKIMMSNKYKVINNAINIEEFAFSENIRNKYRSELKINNKYVIGHVGRFCDQKNHEEIINIFYKYYEKNNNAHLILIGTGELEDVIKAKVKLLGLEKNVSFLGSRSDVKYIMQAMDVFILPSLYEGLPIVGVEAQISGLACLFANTITQEIKITSNSYFLDLKNLDEWVNKIDQLKKYSRNDIKYLDSKDKFDIKKQAKEVELFLIS